MFNPNDKYTKTLTPKLFHYRSQILGHSSQHISSDSGQFCKELILIITLSKASCHLPIYWSWIRFMTPISTIWTCNFGWLSKASLRLSWKWFSPHLLARRAILNVFGKRILKFWVCEFGLNVSKWVVFWFWRSLKHGPRGSLMNTVMGFGTERDLRDHLI